MDTTFFEGVPYAKVATAMNMSDLQDVSDTNPLVDEVLKWNGTEFAPASDAVDDADAIVGGALIKQLLSSRMKS